MSALAIYKCTACPPPAVHTTFDHEEHGEGACLIHGCPCTKMVPGDRYHAEHEERLSKEDLMERAKKRGEEDAAIERGL